MRHTLAPAAYLLSAAVLSLAACAKPTEPAGEAALGRVIARGSLTLADGQDVPCCSVAGSGAHTTIVGGELDLYAQAHYADTVATPGGLMSGACVQEVPDGGVVHPSGLVTLPDGTSYLLLPCSVGGYRLTLTLRVDHANGSTETKEVLVATGGFSWRRDRLTLADFEARLVIASLSGATVTVTVPNHRYQFVAVSMR